ncbi:MAG TPA: hypothetical protein VF108_00910, partial [Actinomycetota bacterium]
RSTSVNVAMATPLSVDARVGAVLERKQDRRPRHGRVLRRGPRAREELGLRELLSAAERLVADRLDGELP